MKTFKNARWATSILAIAFLSASSSCRKTVEDEPQQQQRSNRKTNETEASQVPQPSDLAAVARSTNQLGIDVFRSTAEPANAEFVLSPLSISVAMAMVRTGAAGNTSLEMNKALRHNVIVGSADDETVVDKAFAGIAERIKATNQIDGIAAAMSNRVYAQKGVGFLPTFKERLAQSFGAGFLEVDFENHSQRLHNEINNWVSDQTKKMIPALLEPGFPNAATKLVLVNAVYFKGSWLSAFDRKVTQKAPFFGPEGESEVDLMYQRGKFRTGRIPGGQVLELPYKGDALSMMVVLPDERDGLAALEKNLDAQSVEQFAKNLRAQESDVWFPRFRAEVSKLGLDKALSELGMPSAFDPKKADFSAMNGNRSLFISKVIHAAVVEVSEEGTKAAAATAIGGAPTSALVNTVKFRADHPFLFFIRDRQTGVVLFMGRVTTPKSP